MDITVAPCQISEKLDCFSTATYECFNHTNTWSEENESWRVVGRKGERRFISSS